MTGSVPALSGARSLRDRTGAGVGRRFGPGRVPASLVVRFRRNRAPKKRAATRARCSPSWEVRSLRDPDRCRRRAAVRARPGPGVTRDPVSEKPGSRRRGPQREHGARPLGVRSLRDRIGAGGGRQFGPGRVPASLVVRFRRNRITDLFDSQRRLDRIRPTRGASSVDNAGSEGLSEGLIEAPLREQGGWLGVGRARPPGARKFRSTESGLASGPQSPRLAPGAWLRQARYFPAARQGPAGSERSLGLPGAGTAQRPAVPPARAGGLLWARSGRSLRASCSSTVHPPMPAGLVC